MSNHNSQPENANSHITKKEKEKKVFFRKNPTTTGDTTTYATEITANATNDSCIRAASLDFAETYFFVMHFCLKILLV